MEHELHHDTIVAVATPPGEGGIGVVRLSGRDALSIGKRLFSFFVTPKKIISHKMYFGQMTGPDGDFIDQGLFVYMGSPHSYTGEDIVELQCHGGPLLLETLVIEAVSLGARVANRGEFTRRAFMNGKLDLAQAEAVVDLISSMSRDGLMISARQLGGRLSREIFDMRKLLVDLLSEVETSIDFPEEELDTVSSDEVVHEIGLIRERISKLLSTYREGRIYREGASVVIIGRPNVGKSSLMNLLLEFDRAIVTPEPGTTRDTVSDFTNIGGIPVKLVDTCGLSETSSSAEKEGVRRALEAARGADLIIMVVDVTSGITGEEKKIIDEMGDVGMVVVFNKIDLLPDGADSYNPPKIDYPTAATSALLNIGIDGLKQEIREAVKYGGGSLKDDVIINNLRHYEAIKRAGDYLDEVIKGGENGVPPDLIAVDMRGALSCLGEITGEVTADDVLDVIFSRFCIGK
jgi:tRNA modification GTPase